MKAKKVKESIVNELMDYRQNPQFAMDFAGEMEELEAQLHQQDPAAWGNWEKETGQAWRDEGVEDWMRFYAKEAMDGLMWKNRLKSLLGIRESVNEGFATEEGRNLDSIARLLGYDDLHEMLGDNPGLYEACVTWIDETFAEQLSHEQMDPSELERLGLYGAAEESRVQWDENDVDDEE